MKKGLVFSLFLFAALLVPPISYGQTVFSVSGKIKDRLSGQFLLGARIILDQNIDTACITDSSGFYSIQLKQGYYTIKIVMSGYIEKVIQVNVDQTVQQDIKLDPLPILKDVVVFSKTNNINTAISGRELISMNAVDKTPLFFGEKDILKTIVLLPGVTNAGDGNANFFVRGGAADQNLILYDGAPVYNPSHVFGFFSVFNNDVIKDATLYKGNEPAMFGGRLSSVLDIKTKDGDLNEQKITAGIGNITSRVSIEGPLRTDQSSYFIALRKTHVNYLLSLSDEFKKNKIDIYDLNFKYKNIIDSGSRLYISGYLGKDKIAIGENVGVSWGNKLLALRWEKYLSKKIVSNSTAFMGNYFYNNLFKTTTADLILNSSIANYGLKQDFLYHKNNNNTLGFGLNSIYYVTNPQILFQDNKSGFKNNEKGGLENVLYFNWDSKLSSAFFVDLGVRLSGFTVANTETENLLGNNQLTQNTSKNKSLTYFNVEPRITGSYLLNKQTSIKLAYARNVQHLHLLNNANISDQWIINSNKIMPEISDQFSLGWERWLKNKLYQVNFDIYYKFLQNQLDFKEGIGLNSIVDYESVLASGIGRAYGLEVKLSKNYGLFSGWISYSLSKSEKKIEGINDNNWYNAIQDRTHNLSVVAMYNLTERLVLSSVFVYNTGNAITYPVGRYNVGGQSVFEYGARNANRMPGYNRLDLSVTYENKLKKRMSGAWNFSLFNVYGQENPFRITFEEDPKDNTKTKIVQTALFKWVPSISYTLTF
jgi:hypothetical protein